MRIQKAEYENYLSIFHILLFKIYILRECLAQSLECHLGHLHLALESLEV